MLRNGGNRLENGDQGTQQDGAAIFANAIGAIGEERQRQLALATDELRQEMQTLAERVRALVLAQPPQALLGYFWGKMIMALHADECQANRDTYKSTIITFQFALEYLHAIWATDVGPDAEPLNLDEEKVAELESTLDELQRVASTFNMASSMANTSREFGDKTQEVDLHAKNNWLMMRGNRYQVLEEEFFRFVLQPHNDQILAEYGIGAIEIAAGIQAIADSIRLGFGDAAEVLQQRMVEAGIEAADQGVSLETIAQMRTQDPAFMGEMDGVIKDLFYGGFCNLSRHTGLPVPLLEDLAFSRGGNQDFFAEEPFKGTPLRTLPARIRPLIKLADGYYATDGQFVRDAAYRAIQRALLARAPGYREQWKERQTSLVETAMPTILNAQFRDAKIHTAVYFRDVTTNEWAETDLVASIEDVLLIVEAKSGVAGMGSPAINFERHARAVRELVTNAYRQCDRFLRYLDSAPQVSIYKLENGRHVEVGKLKLRDYRLIVPIGLTVESFSPFSAMCKELPEVTPILGRHPFVSMSVDDLFVLNRLLPTAGEFFHYLEVRQQVAGIRNTMLFDEMDHLGAYIADNRFDETLREHLENGDLVVWDSFSDRVDTHFEQEDWANAPVPSQEYPPILKNILDRLNQSASNARLRVDAHCRNFSGESRTALANALEPLRQTLREHPIRRITFGAQPPLQVWLCRAPNTPTQADIITQAEIACLVTQSPFALVLVTSFDSTGVVRMVRSQQVIAPSILRIDYQLLAAEAERQRGRIQPLRR